MTLHRSGRIAEAEGKYNAVLKLAPDHPDALHLLGMLRRDQGQFDQALALMRRAIEVQRSPIYLSNLGNVLSAQGKTDEAIAALRQATQLRPDLPEIHANLAS